MAARAAAQTPASPAPIALPTVQVTASQQELLNAIDRKIYNVGQNAQGVTGSAADVLQNIPSVQVDLDGNVSLRGDDNVQILIDGRSSALLGTTSRADVLAQLPADSIERIEVITNPSAKYKPDGTAGIINIVLKQKRARGYSGSVRLTVGNDRRYGLSVGGNYHPGKYNLSGTWSVRQDDRPRLATDTRNYLDPTTNLPATTSAITREHSRPVTEIGEFGFDYTPASSDKLGETLNYSDRTFFRFADESDQSTIGTTTSSYDRVRTDPEYERNAESRSTYEHDFGRDDDTLNAEFRWEHHTETENNLYANVSNLPAAPTTYDRTKIFTNEPGTELIVEYADAIAAASKVEAGFDLSDNRSRQGHLGLDQDPATGLWLNDPAVTNLFVLDQTVTALYGTYRRAFGSFAALAGARVEEAEVQTDQVTAAIAGSQRYARLYPSLHLTYDLTETQELQLNYSHRVRRPDYDDLNPYPEYQDPYNLRAGNPALRPEEAHSLEAGYQYKRDDTTYLGTLFYRYSYNGFTTVSQYINSTTLLTTEENLAETQSGGLELAATTTPWAALSLNASGDVYYNEIDASNLGYSTTLSTYAWAGKLSADYAWSKATTWQLNCIYTAKRLTPQGYRRPTFVTNLGLKHELKGRNVSLVFTVSDLFNSLKEETVLNTPALREDATRRRSSRIFYAGVVYAFGAGKKKGKDDALQFDNQL
jgi:outer membrane receptor protein involved in Fe transport